MKLSSAFLLVVLLASFAFAQAEQAPITEKKIDYQNWTYPNVMTGEAMELRKFAQGKKLVMVAYWAPWCLNWRHDVAFVQGLYEKYKGNGFDVVGVAAYDPVASMQNHIKQYKLTFPSVYETDQRNARLTSEHYKYRTAAGDTRKWGTPFYVFIDGTANGPEGDVIAETPPVVAGELIKDDVEKFIRERLGLDQAAAAK